jgi:glycosyltransferase involved in cell wall biosynthesis
VSDSTVDLQEVAAPQPAAALRPAPQGRAPPRRVLHLLKYFRPDYTGEGLYIEKLAPLLQAEGIVSDVAVAATRRPTLAPTLNGIGSVTYFGPPGNEARFNIALVPWLVRRLRKYDVVHVHSPVDRHFLPQVMARLSGVRVVQSCTLDDGLGTLLASYRSALRPLARVLCRSIDMTVAISPRLHADCLQVIGPERVRLIPQGVLMPPDIASRAALRAQAGYAAEDMVLLCVAGLCRRKDIGFLIENHIRLAESWPHLRLLLVGPDLEPDYAAELRHRVQAAEQQGLLAPGRVMFAGYRDDPWPLYRMADLFVFASRAEGFGNVLLEAMAARLPVVARRLPGVTDSFIADGETGFLFDDAEGYSRAVSRLAGDSVLRTAMGRDAAAAAAGHDLRAIARRYAELYRGLIVDGG